jgi:hypothetical protein
MEINNGTNNGNPMTISIDENPYRSNVNYQLLVEQTLVNIRECHAHLHSLAKTTVTLNLTVFAVFGAIVFHAGGASSPSTGGHLSALFGPYGITIKSAIAVLATLFGVVFNAGALTGFINLVKHIDASKECLRKTVPYGDTTAPFFDLVIRNKRGPTFYLTVIFYIFCMINWLCIGAAIYAANV